jgi:hypothetical protein
MPIILYPWCFYCLGRGVLGPSGAGASRKFGQDEERGGTLEKKRAGA